MDRRSFLTASAVGIMFGSLLFSSSNVSADEPMSAAVIQTLPKDGVWSEYQVFVKVQGREIAVTWTVRSVGQAFHGGKQCRFLEMELADNTNAVRGKTWRLLVPEDEFGEGKDPVSKAVKRWIKQGTDEPEAVESLAIKDPPLALFLAGPTLKLKTDEAKEKIAWQQGELECAVVSGRSELGFGNQKISLSQRVFRHKDVPFGFAGTHMDLSGSFGGQDESATIKMMLRDHGKDAKAKLPDLQP
jgi:hypothetical protein